MRGIHAVRVATAVLGVLAVVSAGEARQHKLPQSHAGDFDFYLLSMSIDPSFCALSPANRSKPDCRDLTAETFRQTPLTIHGLWPNRAHVSVNQQPAQCTRDALRLSDAVKTDLARYMPGGPDLEQHEWSKHGTCSGMSPDEYFAAAVGLARQMNDVVGGVMQSSGMLDGEVDVKRLIDGVAARDPAVAAAIVVDCRQPSGGGAHAPAPLVDEIRFTLSKELKPIPARSVGMGQNSGCKGGVGRIPPVR
jgi:ribonuclease T2